MLLRPVLSGTMAFVSIYFSLGSNLGNRERNIEEALHRMDEAFEGHYTALSRLIETKPMGFSGGKFLNAVALYRTFRPEIPAEDAAKDVLSKVKSIERAMGRTDPPEYDGAGNRIYHSRVIDIDILLYDDLKIDEPDLKIPHPLMEEREFVMVPLREILCDYFS